ncbi:hypothetical protein VTK73DRAFT_10233 [Phialemonium thermophilum]|uniref:Uncharacterized protein n=1 Tax=Phialemonium thermophilum TaxID=223376 RepID=A0ABR3XHW7_9PEZI
MNSGSSPNRNKNTHDNSTGLQVGPSRTRSASGAGGLLSKIPFMRSNGQSSGSRTRYGDADADRLETPPSPHSSPMVAHEISSAMSQVVLQQQQHQKTRRRRGSLRKVALLGRGAQRERRDSRSLSINTTADAISQSGTGIVGQGLGVMSDPFRADRMDSALTPGADGEARSGYGLGISDITPRPSMDGYARRDPDAMGGTPASGSERAMSASTTNTMGNSSGMPRNRGDSEATVKSPLISYSTTDDEEASHTRSGTGASTLTSSPGSPILRAEHASLSSGSESYFPTIKQRSIGLGASIVGSRDMPSLQRRRSATAQRAKSPLGLTSLAGLSTTPLPAADAGWDYSETEWWGWVLLIVTWLVFVTGMGSCLGVWSWAWDVGTTPYAPPELEDDPTLPIVGYYPALMILTGVMAWVWVVVAWVGMKYFRHARVSGD